MISYILRYYNQLDRTQSDYGMQFEDDIPEAATMKYIEDFLSANGFVEISDNTWENLELFSKCKVIKNHYETK